MRLIRHFIWIAPILGILGCFSYFLYFYFFEIGPVTAVLRDTAGLNLALALLALILAIICLMACWKRYTIPAKCMSILNVLICSSCLTMLAVYVFYISSQMPSISTTSELKKMEAFTLVNADGTIIESNQGDYQGKNLLLSFYRGYR